MKLSIKQTTQFMTTSLGMATLALLPHVASAQGDAPAAPAAAPGAPMAAPAGQMKGPAEEEVYGPTKGAKSLSLSGSIQHQSVSGGGGSATTSSINAELGFFASPQLEYGVNATVLRTAGFSGYVLGLDGKYHFVKQSKVQKSIPYIDLTIGKGFSDLKGTTYGGAVGVDFYVHPRQAIFLELRYTHDRFSGGPNINSYGPRFGMRMLFK